MKIDRPKVGTGTQPTLTKKEIAELNPSADVQRIMGMEADNEFNPEVNQPITDPGARSYAARIQQRVANKKKASALKGKAPPLGHVESPSSEKMEAIAGLHGGMAQPQFFESVPEDMREPPDLKPKPNPKPPTGVGSAYPGNQAMARGQTNGPISLRQANDMAQARSNFSPETVQALKMAQENVDAAQHEEAPPLDNRGEEPGPTAGSSKKSVAEETRDELAEAELDFEPDSPLDGMDMATIADIRTGLMSKERREAIEKRLKDLDITDMVMKKEIQQEIPIIPGKLSVTLRTFNQRENIWILKYIYDYPGSALYTQELVNTCRLTCGIVAINGKYLPDHRKDVGKMTEDIVKEDFEKKMFHIASFPVQLVADFSVQSIWFQDRVDKLFTVDVLKNG